MPAAEPVLLVTGVGMAAAVGLRTVPVLAEHFRVLAFHAGRPSGSAPVRTVIDQLADEAVAMLDAAGEARFHVYGLSFGGMVAQEIAARHPERLKTLVLGATTAGGDLRVSADDATQDFIRRRARMPAEEGLWASVPYSYAVLTRRRHAQRIGQDIAQRMKAPVDRDVHHIQRQAVLAHDAGDRLRGIAVPTLVVHGEEDLMVPPANGVRLGQVIPGARVLLLPGAAHLYPTDVPDADQRVASFLLEHSPSRRQRRPGESGHAARA